jgi:hypothetical protein
MMALTQLEQKESHDAFKPGPGDIFRLDFIAAGSYRRTSRQRDVSWQTPTQWFCRVRRRHFRIFRPLVQGTRELL